MTPHVLISGAGIAGPALAFWLRRRGVTPTLIEHAPRFRDSGYLIDVWGIGFDLLERMGLLGEARARGYSFDHLTFVDEDGQPLSGFDAATFRRAWGIGSSQSRGGTSPASSSTRSRTGSRRSTPRRWRPCVRMARASASR